MARDTRDEPAEDTSGGQPWQHNRTVVFGAGALGLVLLAALVYAVVQMSDQWSQPASTLPTTGVPTLTTTATTLERQPLIITPSESTTSFTTSVPLSTTEIGLPPPEASPETETSGTETSTESTSPEESTPESTPATTPPTRRTTATQSEDDDTAPTTTRKRPRLNQTRTLSP